MNNVDINFEKLTDLVAMKDEVEKKNYLENVNLKTEKDVINIKEEEIKGNNSDANKTIDIRKLVEYYKNVFSENEKKYLWRMFLTYSSDNVKFN
jgi:hypothetical protein